MRAVDLGRDLHGQRGLAQRRGGHLGVRGGLDEVAAQPMKTLAWPSRSARIASTVSSPCSRGGSKPNSARSIEEERRRALPDAHRPIALHVGVAAHRHQAGARLAEVSLGQRDG